MTNNLAINVLLNVEKWESIKSKSLYGLIHEMERSHKWNVNNSNSNSSNCLKFIIIEIIMSQPN